MVPTLDDHVEAENETCQSLEDRVLVLERKLAWLLGQPDPGVRCDYGYQHPKVNQVTRCYKGRIQLHKVNDVGMLMHDKHVECPKCLGCGRLYPSPLD